MSSASKRFPTAPAAKMLAQAIPGPSNWPARKPNKTPKPIFVSR
jgi:hypothetical protein